MPEKKLGIDIGKKAVRAVVVRPGQKSALIQAAASVPVPEESAPEAAMVELFARLSEQTAMEGLSVNAAFQDCGVSFRNLSVPFTDGKKIRQVLPFELEATLPSHPEEIVADFHVVSRDGHAQCIAAAVSVEMVESQLKSLEPFPVLVQSLSVSAVCEALLYLDGPDAPGQGIFLEISGQNAVAVLFSQGHVVQVRRMEMGGDVLALCAGVDLASLALAERTREPFHPEKLVVTGEGADRPGLEDHLAAHFGVPVERLDLARETGTDIDATVADQWRPHEMDPALALALYEPSETSGFNFRQGHFAVRKRLDEYKQDILHLGVLATICVLAFLVSFVVSTHFLAAQSRDLEKEINAEFLRILPREKKVIDPLRQLQGAVAGLSKGVSPVDEGGPSVRVMDILAVMSEKIKKDLQVKLDTFVLSSEGLQVGGTTDTFNSVDAIKQALEQAPYFSKVTIVSADTDRKTSQVSFRIKASLKETGSDKQSGTAKESGQAKETKPVSQSGPGREASP